ncbi:MAG TPA: UbiA-like polyprenyltransferase [Tenuifilaceae bacterium]|nr:UbiA-like polyprenyltransferase [Tenuifilaceae bacterium]HPE19563.1 UbiA-like polyprenyltransferase [Tenuifilaceae bacterium]HPJ46741.1 UbiA-like polyprenyltransferase [Tenuifilaceae bacterium]HPQ33264.1 UbiA-like polyprenyltransferase [Tenuifilaceae bacterium]HRX69409.1 UbiA-like polyprenyltransferase [Tenuifilaceae bacterium]
MKTNSGGSIKDYLSLVKFSHTIFALPFALVGYFIAIYSNDFDFSVRTLLLVVLCMVFARNAAMSFNRVTDRFIDKRNPRTASREIPSGKIHPRNAFLFSMVNSILFIATTFFINELVFYLSPVALLVVLGYSYTKRFTVLCHFILGLGLSLAPIGAYLAVTGKWALLPILYSLIVLFWVAGFDIIYSLQDEEFDKEEALRSIPAVLGRKKATVLSFILHVGVTVLVIKTMLVQQTGLLLWIGAAVFIGLLILQHIAIRRSSNSKIDFLFATINGFASLLFAILNILSLYFPNLLIN